MKLSAGAIGLVALVVAGCQSAPDNLSIERQWGDTMRRLNMMGFYPMTEDVQIGDVYLHVLPSDADRRNVSRFSLLRLGTAPRDAVWDHLERQQTQDRFVIAPLPARRAEDTSPPTATPRMQPVADARLRPIRRNFIGHADDAGAQIRLRRAAIPTLEVGRLTEAQLAVSGTSRNFGGRFAWGRSSETALRVTLRNVQELTLDAWRSFLLLKQHREAFLNIQARPDLLLFFLSQMNPSLLNAVCMGDQAQLERAQAEIRIVNRVIYAGGIDYTFSRNVESTLRLAADLTSTLPGQPQSAVVPGPFTAITVVGGGPQPAAGGQSAEPRTAQQAAAARLSSLLAAVTGNTGVDGARSGVSSTLAVGAYGTLSLQVDFNRAIAVGAGSAITYSVFEVLGGTREMYTERLQIVEGYCGRNNNNGVNAAALRRAIPEPTQTSGRSVLNAPRAHRAP